MARKDALLRLTSRLIARRDALRKALNGDLDSFRRFSELNAVGDNVDAAVDSANDEICSQLVEIESRELGQIEHALQRIGAGVYGRCEFCGGKISEARLNALPYTNTLHRLPARKRASRAVTGARARLEAMGKSLRKIRRRRERLENQPQRFRDGFQRDRPLRWSRCASHSTSTTKPPETSPAAFFISTCQTRTIVRHWRSTRIR